MRSDERPAGTVEIVSALTGRRMVIPAHAVEIARALGHFADPAETCTVCGTVSPHGGLMTAYRDGREVGAMCAYRLGCTPGLARPDNG